MSGIALIYARNGAPVDPTVLDKMMTALAHRGPDGSHGLVHSPFGMGHQHFWVTPEEVGEQQPLTGEALTIAFDGRLDNRSEILTGLNLTTNDDRNLSDAALVLRAYRHWGNSCFYRLLGPFAVALYDHHKQKVICACDPLGDRSLCYYANHEIVLIASEEQALLTHTAVSNSLNEEMVANYFAFQGLSDGSTMFADIKMVQQGTMMVFDQDGVYSTQYWDYSPPADIRYKSDDEYAEHFLSLLQESVRCRLRSTTPAAVLMSGGLDSTSVAAVAAQMQAEPLTTISWVFDELEQSDERIFIDACNNHLQTNPYLITGDDEWPLSGPDPWPINPNHPFCDAYQRLNERSYMAASERKCRPLLTGLCGDNLYVGIEEWMTDLLREGRVWEAVVEWNRHNRWRGIRNTWTEPSWRRLARIGLNRLPGGSRIRPEHPRWRSWLTHTANEQVQSSDCYAPVLPPVVRRPVQFRNLYDAFNKRVVNTLASNAMHYEVDLRHPYRDRRLLQFALALPAHQFYLQGYYKFVARQAMQKLLPETVRLRTYESTLTPLVFRGFAERELQKVFQILNKADAGWSKFVTADLISLENTEKLQNDLYNLSGLELGVIWSCISFELWRERIPDRSDANTHTPSLFTEYWHIEKEESIL